MKELKRKNTSISLVQLHDLLPFHTEEEVNKYYGKAQNLSIGHSDAVIKYNRNLRVMATFKEDYKKATKPELKDFYNRILESLKKENFDLKKNINYLSYFP